MRTLLIAAAMLAVAGTAHATDPAADAAAHQFTACGVPPCKGGPPAAAEGGTSGSGPGALRTAPVDSPVATGAGGGTGSKGTGNSN